MPSIILYKGKTVVSGGGGVTLPLNSLPSPFTGDTSCTFWFEGSSKNFAGTTCQYSALLPISRHTQGWSGIAWQTTQYPNLSITNVGSSFNMSADFTLATWTSLDLTSNSDQQLICADQPGGARGWALVLRVLSPSNSKWNFYVRESVSLSTSVTTTANYVNDGLPHFYIITYTASSRTFLIYRDTALILTVVAPAAGVPAPTNLLRFGYWNAGDSYRQLRGHTRQLVGFTRVLSSSELSSLYNSGSGNFLF